MAYEILLPGSQVCGRMVQGHPMEGHQKKDDRTGQLKTSADGSPMMDFFYAVAIQKQGEAHWNQTEWGSQIQAAGVEGWPNGEHQQPAFAWKVIDGDSNIPDKRGSAPCTKEGFPGHWVVRVSSGFPTPCWHAGMLRPDQVIQNKAEIKCGDYVRVKVLVKGNGPNCQSPGVYINPMMLELSRAGIQIISASAPDANEAFGGSQAQLPQNAMVDPNVGGQQQQQQNNGNNQNFQQNNGGQPQQGNNQQNYGNNPQNYQNNQNNGNNQQNSSGHQQQNNGNNQNFQQNNGGQPQQGNNNGQATNTPVQGYQQAHENFLNNGNNQNNNGGNNQNNGGQQQQGNNQNNNGQQ